MSRKWIHLAVGLFVLAAYDPANSAGSSQKLPWATAEKLASEAVRICEERGYSVAAAVVDPSGIQQVVIRGDAAPVHTLSVAYRKAYTAFFFGRNYNKNTIGELIAGKLTGPENGALNTVPEFCSCQAEWSCARRTTPRSAGWEYPERRVATKTRLAQLTLPQSFKTSCNDAMRLGDRFLDVEGIGGLNDVRSAAD